MITSPLTNTYQQYQKIKLDILNSQKGHYAYDKTYARNDILLNLVTQLEKDIFELKYNQLTAHKFNPIIPFQPTQA